MNDSTIDLVCKVVLARLSISGFPTFGVNARQSSDKASPLRYFDFSEVVSSTRVVRFVRVQLNVPFIELVSRAVEM